MRRPSSVDALAEFGRARLSRSFFMRDFLYSDIAALHGFSNVPDDPDLAITAGTKLCTELLEPLQDVFGRIAIRSAYRSAEVNGFGNQMQRDKKKGYNCASNESNYGHHIWDRRDAEGNMGATACVVIPAFYDAFHAEGDWQKLAWWIHDHLPYSTLYFFPKLWAVNIQWRENPVRQIDSYTAPRGRLTDESKPNFYGSHEAAWASLRDVFPKA